MRRFAAVGRCTALLGIFFLWVPAGRAGAAILNAIPSLSLEERWDSNVTNTPDNTVSDFVFRATPRLTLSLATSRTTLNISGSFELERYSKRKDLDSNTAVKDFTLSSTEPIHLSPFLLVRPSARFLETQDSSRRMVLTQSIEPGAPLPDSIVTVRTGQRDTSGAVSFTYLTTPKLDLAAGGSVMKREFTVNTPTLVDSRSIKGDASFMYRNTRRLSTGMFFETSYNSFDGQPSNRIYSSGIRGSLVVGDNTIVDAQAGATYLRESTDIGDQKKDTWSPSGRLSVIYKVETLSVMVLGSYELAGVGSTGTPSKRGTVQLALSSRFAPRWWWDLTGSFQRNRFIDFEQTADVDTASGSAGLRYQVAEWASLRLTGSTLRQRSQGIVAVTDLDRNAIMLGLDLSTLYTLF